MHAYIHTYTHTHTYINTHTHTQISELQVRVRELEVQSESHFSNTERIQLTARCEELEKIERTTRMDFERALTGETM